jgi:hypothetical protein
VEYHSCYKGVFVNTISATRNLEQELTNALRNFPRGTYAIIAASRTIPDDQKNSPVFALAHGLYWQIEDRNISLLKVQHRSL